jgi:hypothetical protein
LSTLLVGYDLNKPAQDYPGLIDYLKSFGTWWHHLDSTWLVQTSMTAAELRDALRPYLDSDDELLVVNVTGDAAAWRGFSDKASQWLKDNL